VRVIVENKVAPFFRTRYINPRLQYTKRETPLLFIPAHLAGAGRCFQLVFIAEWRVANALVVFGIATDAECWQLANDRPLSQH